MILSGDSNVVTGPPWKSVKDAQKHGKFLSFSFGGSVVPTAVSLS
jgi:hypothetical protein